jgi:hypothetical protein
VANLQKHVKSVSDEWLEAETNPIPTHARSPHILGYYIKDRRLDPWRYTAPRRPARQKLLIRMAGQPADLDERVRVINRKLKENGAPFRLRRV